MKVYTAYTEKGKPYPQIILQGEWLKRTGFNEGDYIAVDYKDGAIKIVNVGELDDSDE